MLTAIGWMNTDGRPLTGGQAARAADSTRAVLGRLGALPDGRGPGGPGPGGPGPGGSPWPTPDGVAFARAALRTWPLAS